MNTKLTVTLTKDEIGIAVKEYLKARKLEVVGNFAFLTGSRIEGYGSNESEVTYFDGVSAECKQIK